ncbi:ubiquitin-like small modifier protein 1 [Limnochorda pilosa]|uniref:Molybdenum cofactor biosynthesis protein MoaD n=1 Tax=Limnochorda pilosa TaxID=1555112 RepID=A0A0K2SG68_LIMPI|nr:ubiquitin-like small modifier protein 1 [Limnochorda pilosa]BAS26096.1 molybdenum cofactor biosynthesis protein MoaD [Limnochorda pilosa]
MPRFVIPGLLQSITAGEREVPAEGGTVAEALAALTRLYPEARSRLFAEDGTLRTHVNLFVNEEDIRFLRGLETPVAESDEILIIPAMAGGS